MARRIRSITTGTIVRKQCATVRKSDEPAINAQHGTLQNVKGPTTAAWQEFLRTTGVPHMRHTRDANELFEVPRDELGAVVGNDARLRLRVLLLGGLQNDLNLSFGHGFA